jgi:hypothetical protein
VKQVGRELGVRYVLEGSVRKGGNRVRITAQLIDATNGAHLWADRFDGLLEEVFELQDKVAISVAGEAWAPRGSRNRASAISRWKEAEARFAGYITRDDRSAPVRAFLA